MALTLPQAEERRKSAIEQNRNLPITKYPTKEALSEQVWEVTEGLKHVPHESGKGYRTLTPGMRFHPTQKQVAQTVTGRGGLTNKARELNGSEYAGIGRADRKPMSTGADIGLRSLPMADGTRKLAWDYGLTEEDFQGLEPGHGGKYTKDQVEDLYALKQSADQN